MENKDFSRGKMTAWICGTVAVSALAVVWAISSQRGPIDPYAECDNIFGVRDTQCAAEIGSQRIRGGVEEDLLADPQQ